MKKAVVLILTLVMLVMALTAQAVSLTDLGDKPEPALRTMPEATVENIPMYDDDSACVFLGRVNLLDSQTGLGYEFVSFPSDPWKQAQELIQYNNQLILAGYNTPNFDKFDGENQQYLSFSASKKPSVYLLPYLKENALIAVVRYDNDILDAFPAELSAGDALAALIAQLDSEDTREAASAKLAAIWKTPDMERAVKDRITADNMDMMLPLLILKDYFTCFETDGEVNVSASVKEIGYVIRDIVDASETVDGKLALAKKAADTVLPVVDERYLNTTSLVWNSTDMEGSDVTEALPAMPEFDSAAELPEDLKDDGEAHKYIIVSERSSVYRLMPYHAAFLPVDQIAESIAEADRIIVCHNYYQRSSGKWIGGTPSDSMTLIDLYDADGGLVCHIGYAGNYQGGVSHGGIPHDWIEMTQKITEYFSAAR